MRIRTLWGKWYFKDQHIALELSTLAESISLFLVQGAKFGGRLVHGGQSTHVQFIGRRGLQA